MNTNHVLVIAEMRAAELLDALAAAVAGDAHWRMQAQALLRSIDAGEVPDRQPATEIMEQE